MNTATRGCTWRNISLTVVWISSVLLLPTTFSACGDSSADAPAPLVIDEHPSETYLVGIAAGDFECESLLSEAKSTELFGGRVSLIESPFTPPTGVPRACNYLSHDAGREPLKWGYDLDCREGALSDAGKLFVGYADAPDAVPLRVGQSALDHNDTSLLFIDDNTPCYGRVLGPNRNGRRQLATLLVESLTPRSAPTGAHFLVRD